MFSLFVVVGLVEACERAGIQLVCSDSEESEQGLGLNSERGEETRPDDEKANSPLSSAALQVMNTMH